MLGSRVRAPKGAQRTEIRNGLRFSYMLFSELPAIADNTKRIYKNYKEKIVFFVCLLYIYISLQAQKESDEFSSQHGLN